MLVPSEGCEGESVHASLLASGALLAIFGVPWILLHHPNLCLHFHMAFSLCVCVCVCVSVLSFCKDTGHIRIHLNSLIFTLLSQ